MWSVGRYDLGLSESEFWSLTLREYCALADRYEKAEYAASYRSALVTSAIYNVNRTKGQPVIKPEDFLPARKTRREKQSPDEMFGIIRGIHATLGGAPPVE